MASTDSYRGAISLSNSRYASPQTKAPFAAFPSAAPTPSKVSVKDGNNNTIATKEQIAAAAAKADVNVDAQLAIAQNVALKEEVGKHSAAVSKSISSAIANTRQLLVLIRESIKKESPTTAKTDLETVDALWQELELLFKATQDAKTALPKFLDQQKDNMSLYHNAMVNETFCDVQEELNIQHKKINIQHTLILDQKQAFENYKAEAESKIEKLNGLQERVSRLTLDEGLLRTELDKAQQQLEQAQSNQVADVKKAEALQKEVELLISTKKELVAENDALRSMISDLQEKIKTAEQKATDHSEKEILRLSDQYGKEKKRADGLDAVVKSLQTGESEIQRENLKLKSELKLVSDKYKHQTAEFSKAFTNLNEQTKKVNTITADAERLQKEKVDLKERLDKMDKLDREVSELARVKNTLQNQLEDVGSERDKAKDAANRATKEATALSDKLQRVEEENDELESENKSLRSKRAELEKVTAVLNILKGENTKLRTAVQELQNNPTTSSSSGTVATLEKEKKLLEEKIQETEEAKASAEKAVEEWTVVAKRSYKEYKDMQPLYKQADKYRQENEQLKAQFAQAQSGKQSNGTGKDGDGAYWRAKYDALLASCE